MTKQEMIKALESGLTVHWVNNSYKVIYQNDDLYEINIYNDSMCKLSESEYSKCFIGVLSHVSY